MCGRYAMTMDPQAIQQSLEAHGFKIEKLVHPEKVTPSLNKAPQSNAMVYCKNEGKAELVSMRWGLQPSWAKEFFAKTFNTRSESLDPLSKVWSSVTRRRGFVPIQGYYEWDQTTRDRYYIHPIDLHSCGRNEELQDSRSATSEGVIDAKDVEVSHEPDNGVISPSVNASVPENQGSEANKKSSRVPLLYCLVVWDINETICDIPTFSIVTTSAGSTKLGKIHPRLPVIVATREHAERWTNDQWPDALELIEPNSDLDFYPVARDVNKVGVNRPGLNSPVKVQKKLTDFFAPKKRSGEDLLQKSKKRA